MKKMIRKLFGLTLALILVFSLSACGGSSTQKPITDDESTQTSTADQSTTQESESTAETTAVTIENTVLLDQDGLIITAKELVDDSIWGMGVKVLIENNTEENLGVQCNSLIVNNYMITDLFSCSVAAGKKANDTIYLSSSGLEAAGITTISDIVISFHVYDSDTYDTLFDTDEIELKTSAYGTVEQPVMDDGKELYNQDGIRIVGKYVDENSFWGAGVLLFIENNYGENITVQCDNMSINGFMVTPYFSCAVNNGRMALDDITIMSSDLEENDITSVDDIELVFKIFNPDTYQTIVETDPITFSTK
jgi:hypothetical protein